MRRHRWLATLLLAPLLQCQEGSLTAPEVPDDIRAQAIRLRVDIAANTVTQIGIPGNTNVSFSIVGEEGVHAQTSNLTQSPLGNTKTLVRFDVALENLLTGVALNSPTTPAQPPGATGGGILLFPFQMTASTGSGKIVASTDWDGAPFSFFSGSSCKGSASDCFRWEEYSAPLAPRAISAARNVGFEVDKSITAFDVVMLLAADLRNAARAPGGIVLSPNTAQFQSQSGIMTPTTAAVLVTDVDAGTLGGLTASVAYQAGQLDGWLGVPLLSSTFAPSVLTLSPIAVGLPDGTYNATVTVAGVAVSPRTVAVTLIVSGSPVVTNAIYVSATDPNAIDAATCGLGPSNHRGTPCRTISYGLTRAVALTKQAVRVADGSYTEAVTLINGISLLGGFDPQTWQQHLATTNTIIDGVASTGNHDRTVIANGITSATVFEGFVVRGASNAKPGGNSYTMYVANSPALTIRNNAIFGGTGGPGLQGGAGATATPGADGIGRSSNPAGYDSKVTTGTLQCDPSNNRSYANGAVFNISGDDVSGGNGGGTNCPTSNTLAQLSAQNGLPGQAGAGALGGLAGIAGTGGRDFTYGSSPGGAVCFISSTGTHIGGAGSNGGNGQHGAAALGATDADGAVVGSHWTGALGVSGVAGGNGGGGGGGGAGGGAYVSDPAILGKDRLGGVGGGGGAGGGGGGGGGGGSGGGGSFGIFIMGNAPTVTGNAITRGTGGAGGAGGVGATGALGGSGGAGGQVGSVFCTEAGGHGGNGGQGGTGSGGGGGSGGASFGIYTSGAGAPTYCTSGTNTISGGAAGGGGQGGPSQVNPGGAGVAGALLACSFN